jgi:uncharacterized RDD family membrane protein YckC
LDEPARIARRIAPAPAAGSFIMIEVPMSNDPTLRAETAFDATVPVSSGPLPLPPPAPLTPAPPPSSAEARVDHFLLDRQIGQGAMGTVFAARDGSLDRAVAIKFLSEELGHDPEARKRFVREAQAQARVHSPHVVQMYFIGSHVAGPGGRASLYFAMELVLGASLEQFLEKDARLDPELARRLLVQAAQGLREAHAAGIVHRDIKPANLLLDRGGTLKIADFGLAKPREPSLKLTREGTVMGTPHYMAPEQGLGEPLDHRADMYALGCTFYHLLSGRPPFEAPNLVALIAKHLNEPPRPLREVAPAVPPRLAVLVERLMAKKPDERFTSYDELLAALAAAAPEHVEFAGFWARGAALAIDCALGSALIAALGAVGLVVFVAYVTLAHAYFGRTLAKHLLRIEVQRLDGSRLGLPRALARTLVGLWLPFLVGLLVFRSEGLSGLKGTITQLAEFEGAKALVVPFAVGNGLLTLLYLAGVGVAAVHHEKRALHDLVAGSRVVYRLAVR